MDFSIGIIPNQRRGFLVLFVWTNRVKFELNFHEYERPGDTKRHEIKFHLKTKYIGNYFVPIPNDV